MTTRAQTSSKIVTTWYYNEQNRFSLSYCLLYFRTVCANIVFTTHKIFQKFVHTNIYLMTDWQEVKKIHAIADNSCRSNLK